jgi:hypothetical protein
MGTFTVHTIDGYFFFSSPYSRSLCHKTRRGRASQRHLLRSE